jgi:hypothetical protein
MPDPMLRWSLIVPDPILRWLPGGEGFEYFWKKRDSIIFPAPFIWRPKHKAWQLNPAFYLFLTECVLLSTTNLPWPFPAHTGSYNAHDPFVLKYLKEHREVFATPIPQMGWIPQKRKRADPDPLESSWALRQRLRKKLRADPNPMESIDI